jgi:hypothetical protein
VQSDNATEPSAQARREGGSSGAGGGPTREGTTDGPAAAADAGIGTRIASEVDPTTRHHWFDFISTFFRLQNALTGRAGPGRCG